MLTPKAETKLSSSHRHTAVTLTPGPRHRDLLSLLRHRKEEKKDVHMAKLFRYASPKCTSNLFINGKWKFKTGGVSTNIENIRTLINTSFYFPVFRH